MNRVEIDIDSMDWSIYKFITTSLIYLWPLVEINFCLPQKMNEFEALIITHLSKQVPNVVCKYQYSTVYISEVIKITVGSLLFMGINF